MQALVNKVIIFGNSGSGKSTLAKRMAMEHNLAHLDLDTLAWEATDPPTRKPISQSQKSLELFMAKNPCWVIEGCYADLLSWVAEHAKQAIFMNLPVALCQKNASDRSWEPHKYHSKAEQDANLPMLLDWIAAYEERTDEFSYQAHLRLYNQFSGNQHRQQITENQIQQNEK